MFYLFIWMILTFTVCVWQCSTCAVHSPTVKGSLKIFGESTTKDFQKKELKKTCTRRVKWNLILRNAHVNSFTTKCLHIEWRPRCALKCLQCSTHPSLLLHGGQCRRSRAERLLKRKRARPEGVRRSYKFSLRRDDLVISCRLRAQGARSGS